MFEGLLKEWTGESVVVHYDHQTGAWIFIAIHSTRLGAAHGGTRLKTYAVLQDALRDALRLAEGMTYKFAVPGIPRGGGKAVIAISDDFDLGARADLLRRYGALVHQLGGLYYTGPDVGTSAEDMDIIAETGAPYVFGRTLTKGGAGSSGPITALGVFAGIQVVCEQIFGDPSLKGRRVLVQGVGAVGEILIKHLLRAGALVTFSEVDSSKVKPLREEWGLQFVPADQVYSTECDIFAPCALGGILNAVTIRQLRCRAVAGGANNQLAELEDAERLSARGIVYAPDYVINVGGAMAIPGIEAEGWTLMEAEQRVIESVQRALRQIFSIAARENITTEAAARRIAEQHLSKGGLNE